MPWMFCCVCFFFLFFFLFLLSFILEVVLCCDGCSLGANVVTGLFLRLVVNFGVWRHWLVKRVSLIYGGFFIKQRIILLKIILLLTWMPHVNIMANSKQIANIDEYVVSVRNDEDKRKINRWNMINWYNKHPKHE